MPPLKNKGLREREIARFRWAMLGPGLLVLFIINLIPILDTIYTSLFDYYLPMPQDKVFVGLSNYINLFKEPRFLQSCLRTLLFMLMVVSAETLLGFAIALALTSNAFGTKALRGVLILPIMLTPIATAFMWRIMYSPTLGILNYFLELLNIPPQKWIYGANQALPSVAVVVAWCKTPFMVMVFYTGLLSVSDDVLEAARIDGANGWNILWRIKLPLIKPVFFVAILFQTIDTAKEFDFTQILTRGGPGSATESLSIFTYLNSFGFLKMGYGSASAIILSAFIFMLAIFIIKAGGIDFDK
ncbi:MAG: sugar ABC transporter permease [Sphaerochaetaceae bacterium]|nr:sugar ABC transporter permease [Sphaerochaetaceae bacterium]